ncbi:MAG: hypothetical protein R3F37_03340 [Candidatus Competibacteraceae bacterium]
MPKIWINPRIYEIPNGIEEISNEYHEEFYRPYDYWERAEHLIDKDDHSEFDLRDGISNLKKAVDLRFKLIEKLYSFRFLEGKGDKRKYVSILADYDMIRPLFIDSLFQVRNICEHQDAPPPSVDRCKELLDVVWYFIKSTDNRCRNRPEVIDFDDFDEGNNKFTIAYRDTQSLIIFIVGKIDKAHSLVSAIEKWHCITPKVSPVEHDNFFQFNTEALISKSFGQELLQNLVHRP